MFRHLVTHINLKDCHLILAMATRYNILLEKESHIGSKEEITENGHSRFGTEKLKTRFDSENSDVSPEIQKLLGEISDKLNSAKTPSDRHLNGTVGVQERSPAPKSSGVENQAKETAFDWIVLLCSFATNVIYGMDVTTASVFYPSLVEYFQATTADVGWCSSIECFVGSVFSIFSSHLIELYGCRLPGVIGSIIFCLGVGLTSIAPNLPIFYFTYGIVAGYGVSLCGLTANIIAQQRFERNRGFVCGISAIGNSIGGIIGPLVVNFLIRHYTWRGAYLILCAIFAHRIAFSLLFITPEKYLAKRPEIESKRSARDSCRAVGRYLRKTFDFSILWKQKSFALFTSAGCLQIIVLSGYAHHCVNRAVQMGTPLERASWAATIIGISNTVIRIVVTFLGNLSCVNRFLVGAFGLFMSVVSVVVLLVSHDLTGTITSSVLFGFMIGCWGTVLTAMMVDLVGVELLTKSYSIANSFAGVFKLTSTPFIGWIYDVTRNYDLAFAVLGVCGLVACILMLIVYFLHRRQSALNRTENSGIYHLASPNSDTTKEEKRKLASGRQFNLGSTAVK